MSGTVPTNKEVFRMGFQNGNSVPGAFYRAMHMHKRGICCHPRRVALRSAQVTCATAVAHSLMQRLRPRKRTTKYYWITKNVAPVDLVT